DHIISATRDFVDKGAGGARSSLRDGGCRPRNSTKPPGHSSAAAALTSRSERDGVPDPIQIVVDGPVGGEESAAGGVEDRASGPLVAIGPGGIDVVLGVDVGAVIGEDEELVVAEEVVDQGAERAGISRGEPAPGDGIDGPAE